MSVWGSQEEMRKFAVGALFGSEFAGGLGAGTTIQSGGASGGALSPFVQIIGHKEGEYMKEDSFTIVSNSKKQDTEMTLSKIYSLLVQTNFPVNAFENKDTWSKGYAAKGYYIEAGITTIYVYVSWETKYDGKTCDGIYYRIRTGESLSDLSAIGRFWNSTSVTMKIEVPDSSKGFDIPAFYLCGVFIYKFGPYIGRGKGGWYEGYRNVGGGTYGNDLIVSEGDRRLTLNVNHNTLIDLFIIKGCTYGCVLDQSEISEMEKKRFGLNPVKKIYSDGEESLDTLPALVLGSIYNYSTIEVIDLSNGKSCFYMSPRREFLYYLGEGKTYSQEELDAMIT